MSQLHWCLGISAPFTFMLVCIANNDICVLSALKTVRRFSSAQNADRNYRHKIKKFCNFQDRKYVLTSEILYTYSIEQKILSCALKM